MCGKDSKLLSCTDDLQGQTYPSAYLFIISCLGNARFHGRKLRGNCNRLSRSIIMKIAVD